MQDDPEIAKVKAQARETIEKLQNLKPRWYWPLGWFKAVRYQNKVLAEVVALVADCTESNHVIAGAMETNAAVDTHLEQRINRAWKEVYANEDNRKLVEERVEALERNYTNPPPPPEDPTEEEGEN